MKSEFPVDFISAEEIYARVEKILRGYFTAGALTDDMFDTYTRDLLEETGHINLPIQETVLEIRNHIVHLPDYVWLEEVWYCAGESVQITPYETIKGFEYLDAKDKIVPAPVVTPGCTDCGGLANEVDVRRMRILVQNQVYLASFRPSFPLFPGNVNTQRHCLNCAVSSTHSNTYTLMGKRRMNTALPTGYVHVIFRDMQKNEEGFPMVPDHVIFRNSLFNFLMYRSMEDLWHNASDESYAQIQNKMAFYKTEYEMEFVRLSTWNKTPTFAGNMLRARKRKSQMMRYHMR